MSEPIRRAALVALVGGGLVFSAAAEEQEFGRATFLNSRDPPTWSQLKGPERERFDLGHAIFNTHFVQAGTPRASRRDGLGPLFNASACDACHNEGAHGQGPKGDGSLPNALVLELSAPDSNGAAPKGDSHYGRTFNVAALEGFAAEGEARVSYRERAGKFPDGEKFSLRVPTYTLAQLHFGALDKNTIVQPRLAPALFGVGLLERVQTTDEGRFGWQNTAVSLPDQTAQALSRDMGLTSPVLDHDDCTAAQTACRGAPNGGTPELDEEYFAAVVEFQRNLAVPGTVNPRDARGQAQFQRLGCSACHVPSQTVTLEGVGTKEIEPFTDLQRHDLGNELADRTADGRLVTSTFRTAPLWGLGYRIQREQNPTFLHDGRARSPTEAILWHGGEARGSQELFQRLSAAERELLVKWLSSL